MTIPPFSRKMMIPRSRDDDTVQFVVSVIVLVFVLLAIVNLCSGAALIASSLWLALVTLGCVSACRAEGGLRKFLINSVGAVAGQRFIEVVPVDPEPRYLHFGFDLLGHCFIQQSIPLDSIESVEWSTGQATAMAGYEVKNDWHVWVWFNPNNPIRGEKQRPARKRDQDLRGIGPSACKTQAEALGLALVAFLRDAGADLIPGTTATCFVKRRDGDGQSEVQ